MQLKNLHGLSSLAGPLQGALYVSSNLNLESLDGLGNVTSLGKDNSGNSVTLWSNARLKNLQGLRSLAGPLPGALYVDNCTNLESLEGLTGIGRSTLTLTLTLTLP